MIAHDTHAKATLCIHKNVAASLEPDILLKRQVKGTAIRYIAVIVEVKNGEDHFTGSSLGQIYNFLASLLSVEQPWMPFAWGILINQRNVQFIKINKQANGGTFFQKSEVFSVDKSKKVPEGLKRMLWLLHQNDFGLLEGQLTSAHVDIRQYLGRGASSIVFETLAIPKKKAAAKSKGAAENTSHGNVVKLIQVNGSSFNIGELEVQVLKHLSDATGESVRTNIPRLVSHNKAYTSLVLTPKASHFNNKSPFSGRHAVEVLQVLKAAHAAGVVHCDIRPDNLLLGPDGQVLVNDWGAASFYTAGAQPYLGARRYASDKVLALLAESPTIDIDFRPEDDLVAFVRAMCALLVPGMKIPNSTTEPADVMEHWKKMPPFWKDLESTVVPQQKDIEGMPDEECYDALRTEIERVFCSKDQERAHQSSNP